MSKPPAFQFFPRDWLSSVPVRMMTWEERGVFMDLLCYSWLHGGLPPDFGETCRLLSMDSRTWRRVSPKIMQQFQIEKNGLLVNERLEEIRDKQRGVSDVKASAARTRWKKPPPKGDAYASPVQMHMHSENDALRTATASTTAIGDTPRTPLEDGEGCAVCGGRPRGRGRSPTASWRTPGTCPGPARRRSSPRRQRPVWSSRVR